MLRDNLAAAKAQFYMLQDTDSHGNAVYIVSIIFCRRRLVCTAEYTQLLQKHYIGPDQVKHTGQGEIV